MASVPAEETAALRFIRYGAISAMIAVAAGAFGAHALRTRLAPDLLAVFETAARYQMYHALGLFAAAWVATHGRLWTATWAARLFVLGTFLFSGSLYLLALTGERWFGAITPVGGAAFLAGWAFLAASVRGRNGPTAD